MDNKYKQNNWIPAFAGMTVEDAGMTVEDAGMTVEDAGMTVKRRNIDAGVPRHT
jgi:hypothetical protein